MLGGSGGGFDVDKAAVLSRHGVATLAFAYFGIPPLPSWLHRIPIEYFESALRWLSALGLRSTWKRIGLLGVSRGAELSLLLGTLLPEIRAIAAYAPSSVAWAAVNRSRTRPPASRFRPGPGRGKPLPFAPLPLRGFMLRSAIPVVGFRRPVMFRNLFRAGLRNRREVERAELPVETIKAPILLISGGDDHLWPAAKMCEAIVTRRKQSAAAFPTEHITYPRAGHNLRYPHLPTTPRYGRNPHLRGARGFSLWQARPLPTPKRRRSSWQRTIRFLREHLE